MSTHPGKEGKDFHPSFILSFLRRALFGPQPHAWTCPCPQGNRNPVGGLGGGWGSTERPLTQLLGWSGQASWRRWHPTVLKESEAAWAELRAEFTGRGRSVWSTFPFVLS